MADMSGTTIIPAVMCGGSGTRLWPASRQRLPKQFLPVIGSKPLLDATLARIHAAGAMAGPTILIASRDHEFLVRRAVADTGLSASMGIYEPVGRGTAAAIWAIATRAQEIADDPLILVMPADHYIPDAISFFATVQHGIAVARAGNWVTFGITPTAPATGYGYIEAGEPADSGAYRVKRFVEKPDLAAAGKMIASGKYFWNAGIFLVSAKAALEGIARHARPIADAMAVAWAKSVRRNGDVFLDRDALAEVPSNSIDYAVLEHETGTAMVPFNGAWSDVGSWSSVAELTEKDDAGNSAIGNVTLLESRDTYVQAGKRLVTAIGVDQLIVVDTDDATLICHRERAEKVKELLGELRRSNLSKVEEHKFEYRPWGMFERIFEGTGYQVKCLEVSPGGRLSLQYHHHRSEHWVVVRGTPTVTVDDKVLVMHPGQSIDIPLGAVHRLENFGGDPVQIIEIQRGTYLGEDDIVRVEDTYDRPPVPDAPKA
jgi:mannose-1-phosphate guanylyltransferase/mannose-6-phosphate isomerase